jgi:acetylornithine aminotransferase
LGHCHPKITKTIQNQAGQLLHTSNWYQIEHQEALASKLCELTDMDKVFFGNSGAEAIEASIKITRLHAQAKNIQNPIVITAKNSFHGRTMGALSATGNPKVQAGFTPLVGEFISVDFDDLDAIKAHSDNKNVVAVMLEPIQGEAGIYIPKADYLNQVQKICQQNDWLLVLDEVQTGIARTGAWFAFQYNHITPDVLTLAKGLGNGVPIGACLAKGKAAKYFTAGTHGSTFGGNPLVCKTALCVLETIQSENILQNCRTMGEYLKNSLHEALKDSPQVIDIRQKGLMVAIELRGDVSSLLQNALNKKLLINITGQSIRLLPPLIIQKNEVDIIVRTLQQLIQESM